MLILTLLLACTSEKSFAEDYARQLCRFDEHCHKSVFVEDYDGDIDDCIDDILDTVDESASCAFDKEKAATCLSRMRDARQDCDDADRIDDDCYDAFDCPGVLPSKVSESNFYELYLAVYCELDCGNSYAQDQCDNAQDYTSGSFSCPEFNLEKALECLDPDNWSCRSYGYDESEGFPQPPNACNQACYGSYPTAPGDYSTY